MQTNTACQYGCISLNQSCLFTLDSGENALIKGNLITCFAIHKQVEVILVGEKGWDESKMTDKWMSTQQQIVRLIGDGTLKLERCSAILEDNKKWLKKKYKGKIGTAKKITLLYTKTWCNNYWIEIKDLVNQLTSYRLLPIHVLWKWV